MEKHIDQVAGAVRLGAAVVLLGPQGSGKSRLARHHAGTIGAFAEVEARNLGRHFSDEAFSKMSHGPRPALRALIVDGFPSDREVLQEVTSRLPRQAFFFCVLPEDLRTCALVVGAPFPLAVFRLEGPR